MKKLSTLCLVSLLAMMMLSPAYAMTLSDEESISNEAPEAGNSYFNAELTGRYQDGRLATSLGEYRITPGVKVEDRRPMAQWFEVPAKANVQLELDGKQLIRVIIY
tara:strand:+ start:3040 stop:3357 length:318 start_codon:yes stop_codon:yes gene_type:complete